MNQHTSQNWLLVKVPQILLYLHEAWSITSSWGKIVDFLLVVDDEICAIFYSYCSWNIIRASVNDTSKHSYETLIMVRSHIMKQNADFQEGISQA